MKSAAVIAAAALACAVSANPITANVDVASTAVVPIAAFDDSLIVAKKTSLVDIKAIVPGVLALNVDLLSTTTIQKIDFEDVNKKVVVNFPATSLLTIDGLLSLAKGHDALIKLILALGASADKGGCGCTSKHGSHVWVDPTHEDVIAVYKSLLEVLLTKDGILAVTISDLLGLDLLATVDLSGLLETVSGLLHGLGLSLGLYMPRNKVPFSIVDIADCGCVDFVWTKDCLSCKWTKLFHCDDYPMVVDIETQPCTIDVAKGKCKHITTDILGLIQIKSKSTGILGAVNGILDGVGDLLNGLLLGVNTYPCGAVVTDMPVIDLDLKKSNLRQ